MVPRAVPIVEAMAALVLMDAVLAQEARQSARSKLPPLPRKVLPAAMTAVEDRATKEAKLEGVANGH